MANIRLRIEPQGSGNEDNMSFAVNVFLLVQGEEEAFGTLPQLPPALIERWKNWWLAYYGQEALRLELADENEAHEPTSSEIVEHEDLFRGEPRSVIRRRPDEIRNLRDSLIEEFNEWLESPSFARFRETLSNLAGHLNSPVQITLEFRALSPKSVILRRFPWQEWRIFRNYYRNSAIVFGLTSIDNPKSIDKFPESAKIRILVVIGYGQDINPLEDFRILQRLERENPNLVEVVLLAGSDLTLENLRRHLSDSIGYHILVYAGHSETNLNGNIAWLKLTESDRIEIRYFEFNVRRAIENGLKLVIFNSCDGLGLAKQILELGIAQCIVMRDPIPDSAAIRFIEEFFKNFAYESHSLHESVRLTCGALEDLDMQFPGVKWLPLVFARSNAEPLTWQVLVDNLQQSAKPGFLSKLWGLGKNTLGRLWDYASRLWARLSRRLGISLLVLLFVGALIASIAIPQIIPADVVIQPMSMEQKNALKNALKNKDKNDIGVLRTGYENNRNRPDMLIDLLNAIVLENEENSSVYKIGVIVEDYTGRDPDSSKEDDQTLRGIAQSQLEQNCGIDIKQLSSSLENNKNEFEAAILNSSLDELKSQCSGGKNDSILFYVAVDAELKETEDLTKEQALKRTEQFSEDFAKSKDVAGVIGHSNSEKTFHAYDHAYGKNRVTLISPTSTAMRDLSGEWTWLFKRNYLFRTATNDKVAVSMLVNFVDNKLKSNEIKARKVGVVHESKELYSSSYVKIMKSELKEKGIDLIGLEPDLTECDINQKFMPSICVKKLRDQGAEVLLLVPGSGAVVKAQNVISANASYTSPFTYILGSDTMYKGAYEEVRNALDRKQFLIAVPWARDREKPSDFEESARAIWGIGGIEWRTVTSYDAFKILAKATEKAIKEGDLTRLRLHKVLASSSNFSKSAIDENIQFFKENHDRNSSSLGVLAEFSSDETSGETFFKYN